jgi:hypothetical protein
LSPFSLSASNQEEDDTMPKQKPSARLENWAVVESENIASYQELRAGNLLVGKVFSHPTIAEGKFIFSSPVVRFDEKTKVAETRNTSYRLGQASSEYTTWIHEQTGAAA